MIEKAGVSAVEVRQRFGARISELVLAVSDDDRIRGYAKRKAALRHQVAGRGEEALMLFAADKLSKVQELRHEAAIDPDGIVTQGRGRPVRARRLRHYQRSLALLEERLPESPFVRELREELRVFLREHPRFAPAR